MIAGNLTMASKIARMSTKPLGTKASKVVIKAVVNPQRGMLGVKPRPGPKVPGEVRAVRKSR